MGTLFSLRHSAMQPGQHRQEQLDVEIEPYSQSGISYAVPSGHVPAQLDITEMPTGRHFRLRFSAGLQGPCVRCLESATVHVRVDSHEVHDEAAPADDDELRSEFYDEQTEEVDLSAWARAAVGLEFPARVLCDPDCRGLCGVCGVNLNEVKGDHAHEHPTDSRWDALKGLDLEAGEPDGDPDGDAD